jgi:uncharacterized protein (TIGR02186 family)
LKRLLLAALLIAIATPAGAEKLVSTVSSSVVQITSSFDGAVLSLFGTIEPDVLGAPLPGPYNVIVVITGPLQDRVARLKTRNFGIWSNTDQVNFKQFPSFYEVISSGRLDTIAQPELLAEKSVLPADQARKSAQSAGFKAEMFGTELVRLMTEEGHLAVKEEGVRFLSPTAYMAQVSLPSDVANGPFLARTIVLKDREVVAESTNGFSVRKSGFENFVFVSSRQSPLLYGLACVVLALATGWLAGVAFKR